MANPRKLSVYPTTNRRLVEVFRKFDDCRFCREEGNLWQHILGVGQTKKPDSALILINPTCLNTGSRPDWNLYIGSLLLALSIFGKFSR